jgi:hypothetical protein
VFTSSGKTLEEALFDRDGVEEGEWKLAQELILPQEAPGSATVPPSQTQQGYKRFISDIRVDLDCIKAHAKRPGRRTILVVAGIDKLDIVKVFLKRICENDMRFTLITEQSLARELVAHLA